MSSIVYVLILQAARVDAAEELHTWGGELDDALRGERGVRVRTDPQLLTAHIQYNLPTEQMSP